MHILSKQPYYKLLLSFSLGFFVFQPRVLPTAGTHKQSTNALCFSRYTTGITTLTLTVKNTMILPRKRQVIVFLNANCRDLCESVGESEDVREDTSEDARKSASRSASKESENDSNIMEESSSG